MQPDEKTKETRAVYAAADELAAAILNNKAPCKKRDRVELIAFLASTIQSHLAANHDGKANR